MPRTPGDYIVVDKIYKDVMRLMLGMLWAEKTSQAYPMPGPTYFMWDPELNDAETQVAFGPINAFDDMDADFKTWILGRELTTPLGMLVVPASTEALEEIWFKPPPPLDP